MFVRLTTAIFFLLFWISLYGQDSIVNKAKGKIQQVTNTAEELLKVPRTEFQKLFLSDNILRKIKTPADSLAGLTRSVLEPLKDPLAINNVSVMYNHLLDSSYLGNQSAYHFGSLDAMADFTVGGIPGGIQFQNQTWSEIPNQSNGFTYRFDKDAYLDGIKRRLSGKFNPETLMPFTKNPLEGILNQAKQNLGNELKNLNDSYKGLLDDELKKIGDLQSLFTGDVKTLSRQLINSDAVKQLQERENLLSFLQQKINNGETVSPDAMNKVQQEIQKFKAVNELVEKIAAHKAKWEKSGLLSNLRKFNLLQKEKLAGIIKDPSTIRKLAREHLSLKGLQKFFLNMNQFNIGRNEVSTSPMSFRNFLSNGVSAEIAGRGNKTLSLIAGKQKDFNSVLDYVFTDNLNSNTGVAKAVRMGVGTGGRSTSHVSVASFNQSLANQLGTTDFNSFRHVLVTTFSNYLKMGNSGSLAIDLSKSATQYQGKERGNDSTGNIGDLLSLDNLMSGLAVSLKYADEYTASGLSYQVSFNKVANGYVNPGNTFLSGGSTEGGLQVRKTWLKRRLVVSFRGNVRHYQFSERTDMQWRNGYYVLDAKWRLKKGQHIALRYQPVKMLRIENGKKWTVTEVTRLTAETNLYKKIGQLSYRNYISLTGQKNLYALSTTSSEKNNSLLLSSFQHLIIGKQVFYINTNYNHTANSGSYLFLRSSFFGESGCQYTLFKKISASTGVVYNSTDGWYRQAGIRQTVAGQLGEKFNVNIYIDARRNLAEYQPVWNDPVRGEISLQYMLNNRK